MKKQPSPEIAAAVDSMLAEEKERYVSKIEPFEVRASRLRLQMTEALHDFKTSYEQGYTALMGELALMFPKSPLERFMVDDEHLASLVNAKVEDSRLSELLGLADETLLTMYQAARSLMEKNAYDDAKNAFSFLVTVAPHYPLFWLGFGFCSAQCGKFDEAARACEYALGLDPNNPDSYLITARVLVDSGNSAEALNLCRRGIDHAMHHRDEAWAEALMATMQEAIPYVQTAAHNL